MGLLEETKKIYNWEPSDGDYFLKDNAHKRKQSLKLKLRKSILFSTVIVLIVVLLVYLLVII